MTASTESLAPAPPDDDPRVVRALEQYMADLEAGRAPDRAALLAEYADVAGPLADCLGGLDLLAGVKGPGSGVKSGGSDLTPQPSSLTPLQDFRLIREIGRGGMGVVYEAEQVALGRRVAVKVMPAAGGGDYRRFRLEARAAGLLSHPHIVPVYAVGEADGVPYIAMRLIEGWSLAEVIAGKRPAPGTTVSRAEPIDPTTDAAAPPAPPKPGVQADPWFAAGLTLQAADALAHAHEAGVVHRDIKPGNLLLDRTDHLWVADFGLAFLPGATRVTRSGTLVGTLRYLSPEQADPSRGGVDHRVDQYGLGATLYELLTGRPVNDATEAGAALAAVLNTPPVPPRRWNRSIPVDLETVVLKLLAKEPADRYPAMAAAAADLRRFLDGRSVLARRPSVVERAVRWAGRHHQMVGAGVGVVAATFLLQLGNQFRLTRERDATAVERGQARSAVDDLFALYSDRWLARGPGADAGDQKFLAKAQAHYDRLAATPGGTRVDQLAAAVARRRVADIDAKLGRDAEADLGYADAAERFRRLAAANPDWADAGREAAVTAADRGTWLAAHDRLADAAREYAFAAAGFGRLAAANDLRDRAGLAGVENNQGLLWARAGKRSEAEKCFRVARSHFAGLAGEYPDQPAFVAETAGCCHNLAEVLADAGRTDEAEAAYREALTLRYRAADLLPGSPAAAAELARTEAGLADLLLGRGETVESGRLAEAALTRRERLAADAPAVPEYRYLLACSLRTAAGWQAATGRPDDALAGLDRAADLLRSAAGVPGAARERDRVRQTAAEVTNGGSP